MTASWNLVRASVSSCHSDVNIEISVIKMRAKTAKRIEIKDRSIFLNANVFMVYPIKHVLMLLRYNLCHCFGFDFVLVTPYSP